jgi:hypothetical protein
MSKICTLECVQTFLFNKQPEKNKMDEAAFFYLM